MSAQLRWKFIFILIVIFVCVFGMIGFPTSLSQARQNFVDRIRLGLDLKGGSHLVLQVRVNEAIGQRCDQAVDDLRKQLREKNVSVGDVQRVSDTQILVPHVDPAISGTFRDIVSTQFPDWSMAPAAGQQDGYLLTMKSAVVADLERTAMDQSLETITRRINALGLTEPTIAFTGRGANEILVELPGEGDPTRAKEVIQAGG
jgi:preprotein translocase subunit SecD